MQFEYKVVPAPTRGLKAKGLKTPADRFANALSQVINEMAAEGWHYLRAEALPSEERAGLTGRTIVQHNMLMFRRSVDAATTEATEAQDSIAEPRAPKLPSADTAQGMPEVETAPLFAPERETLETQ